MRSRSSFRTCSRHSRKRLSETGTINWSVMRDRCSSGAWPTRAARQSSRRRDGVWSDGRPKSTRAPTTQSCWSNSSRSRANGRKAIARRHGSPCNPNRGCRSGTAPSTDVRSAGRPGLRTNPARFRRPRPRNRRQPGLRNCRVHQPPFRRDFWVFLAPTHLATSAGGNTQTGSLPLPSRTNVRARRIANRRSVICVRPLEGERCWRWPSRCSTSQLSGRCDVPEEAGAGNPRDTRASPGSNRRASGKPAPALVLPAETLMRAACKSTFVPGLWELAGSAFELSDLDPAGAAGRRPRWERAVISRPPLRPFRAWSRASGRALQVETRLSRSYLAPPSSIATLWWTSLASVR